MKVLIGAWACNPNEGSESAVGWSWLNSIKRFHEVWVITSANQKESIEQAVSQHPGEFSNVQFRYVEPQRWRYDRNSKFWRWQASLPILVPVFHVYYDLWQRAAYRAAQELQEHIQFDLVHQLTFVGFRFPGYLWKLKLPFVWGPIGGLDNMPWRLMPALGLGGAAHYAGRNLVNSLHRRFLRRPRKAFAAAGPGIIAATGGIQRQIRRSYNARAQVICEVGLPGRVNDTYFLRNEGEAIRLVWSGLHLSRKALPLLLQALYRLRGNVNWRLDIYGDGPRRQRWYQLATRLGLQDRCTWHGQVSREAALVGLQKAHLFVITSLQDLTSTVLIEALANGVPVVCPDHCGFSDVMTPECGLKLPIQSLEEFKRGLASTISNIYADEKHRRYLAAGALQRARSFSWETKGEAINQVYDRVISGVFREAVRTEKNASQLSVVS